MKAVSIFHRKIYKKESINGNIKTFTKHTCKIFCRNSSSWCFAIFSVTIWLFLSIPLVLGSWWALLCFIPYTILISVRIKSEEKNLEEGLPGYTEYKQKVRWKILPFVW